MLLKPMAHVPNGIRRSIQLLLGGATLSIVASACTTTPYAAKVGASFITVSALNSELHSIGDNLAFVSKLTAQEQVFGNSKSTFTTQFVDQVLNRRIAITLIENANARLGLQITPTVTELARTVAEQTYGGSGAFSAFPAAYQKELTTDTANIMLLEAFLTKTDISLPALAKYYNANVSKFARICAAHIVVATSSAATAIFNQVSGGANFVSLAKSQSIDSNTAANGGYIGCGTYQNFASAFGSSFANELISGAPNVALPPVQISQGYSVPMVVSRTILTFAQAIPAVIGTVFGTQAAGDVNAFVSGLAKSQSVTVNPAYGTFSISNANATVIPPTLPAA